MIIYLSVLVGVSIFLIINALFYEYGTNKDLINKRLYYIKASKSGIVAEDLNKSLIERFVYPAINSFIIKTIRLLPKRSLSEEKSEVTNENLTYKLEDKYKKCINLIKEKSNITIDKIISESKLREAEAGIAELKLKIER